MTTFKKGQRVVLFQSWDNAGTVAYTPAIVYSCGKKRMVLTAEKTGAEIGRNFKPENTDVSYCNWYGIYPEMTEAAAVEKALDSALAATGVELYGSAYNEPRRWNQDLKREKTASEMASEKRRINKTRCYFGGAGESAMREAIKAAGLELKRLGSLPGNVIVL